MLFKGSVSQSLLSFLRKRIGSESFVAMNLLCRKKHSPLSLQRKEGSINYDALLPEKIACFAITASSFGVLIKIRL